MKFVIICLLPGDPVAREDREFTKGVFDFNSIRLMKFAQSMNQEIFADDMIFYGGALNQNGASPENIAGRMIKKIEAGCSYFLTQPVYDEEGIKRLAFLKERTGAKILIGIMPLVSRRNALFIKNEMPGIYVPNRVVEKYKENASREEYEEAAVEISKEIIEMGKEVGAGFYFL
ncbi:MAG: methylenetetrahydrofolate reductase [Anaerobutyricum sp.]